MVMIGFKPSFFLFLFNAELPLADAAAADAPCGSCCAALSLAYCAPFILRGSENRQLSSQDVDRME